MGLVKYLSLSACGALTGFAAYGHAEPERLALSAFLPLAWVFCSRRGETAAFAFAYYALASRGIPSGGAVFFGQDAPFIFSITLWLLSVAALTLPWALLWTNSKSFTEVFGRLLLIFIVLTVPPLGLFGWASPLLSVGFMFPSAGWAALAAFPALFALAATATDKKRLNALLCAAAIVMFAALYPVKVKEAEGIAGIDTSYGRVASGSTGFADAFIRTSDIAVRVLSEEHAYILVPETIAGKWTKETERIWSGFAGLLKSRRQTLIVGAEIYDDADKYDNCMIFLGFDEEARLYRQRIPVPVSMWCPFGVSGTANAYWFDSGIIRFADGRRAAMLICYEQFLAWPILLSFTRFPAPDMIITSANQWWCKDTSIPKIQLQCATAWARLFGVPLASATNI